VKRRSPRIFAESAKISIHTIILSMALSDEKRVAKILQLQLLRFALQDSDDLWNRFPGNAKTCKEGEQSVAGNYDVFFRPNATTGLQAPEVCPTKSIQVIVSFKC
jgi:hypothetical protein